jgi:hypothetical protein
MLHVTACGLNRPTMGRARCADPVLVLGWFFWRERPAGVDFAGAALVISAGLLLAWNRTSRAEPGG